MKLADATTFCQILTPTPSQVNASGWHLIFPDSVSLWREVHGMYSGDVGGGQHALIRFPVMSATALKMSSSSIHL